MSKLLTKINCFPKHKEKTTKPVGENEEIY